MKKKKKRKIKKKNKRNKVKQTKKKKKKKKREEKRTHTRENSDVIKIIITFLFLVQNCRDPYPFVLLYFSVSPNLRPYLSKKDVSLFIILDVQHWTVVDWTIGLPTPWRIACEPGGK